MKKKADRPEQREGQSFVRRQKEMAGAKTGFRQTQADQTWEARRGDRPVFWRF